MRRLHPDQHQADQPLTEMVEDRNGFQMKKRRDYEPDDAFVEQSVILLDMLGGHLLATVQTRECFAQPMYEKLHFRCDILEEYNNHT